MSCKVKFSPEGKILRVDNLDGTESKLFNAISRIPALESMEQALDIYKKMKSTGVSEDGLMFASDKGKVTPDFKEALKDSSNSVKLLNYTDEVATFSASTDPSTKEGLINKLIVSDLVSPEMYVENGERYFQAEGYSGVRAMVSQAILREEIKSNNLGKYEFLFDKTGVFQLNEAPAPADSTNFTEVFQKHGIEEAKAQFVRGTLKELMAQTALKEVGLTDINEDTLRSNLFGLLEEMGVDLMSISEYIENYEIRNGIEPSAEAVADIANSVIAFRDGQIDTDALTEETIHFIVEAMPNEEIDSMLEDVVNTETYSEIREEYSTIYYQQDTNRSSEEVENLVRREALVKEVTKRIQTRFSEEGLSENELSFMGRIIKTIQDFFNNIFIQENTVDRLNDLTEKVEQLIISKDVANYLNLDQLKNKKLQLYKATGSGDGKVDAVVTLLRGLTLSLTEQEKALRRGGQGSAHNIRILNQISEELADANLKKNIAEILQITIKKIDYISQAMEESQTKGIMLNTEQASVLAELVNNTRTGLSRVTNAIQTIPELKDMAPEIEEVSTKINRLEGGIGEVAEGITNRMIDRFIQRTPALANQAEEVKEDLRKALRNAQKDTNVMFSYYGQITHAQDPILNMLGLVIADMTNRAEKTYVDRAKEFMRFLRESNFDPKELKNFVKGKGWFKSPWEWDRFQEDIVKDKVLAHNRALLDIGKEAYNEEELTKFYKGKLKELPEEGRLDATGRLFQGTYFEELTMDKIERPMTPEYYKKRRDRYKTYDPVTNPNGVRGGDISPITQIELRNISAIRNDLVNRTSVDGKVVLDRHSRLEFDELTTRRRRAKSPYNMDGTLKDGFSQPMTEVEYASEITQDGDFKVGDMWYRLGPNPSDEAIISYDLHRIDAKYQEDVANGSIPGMFKNNKLSDDFLDTIKKMIADPNVTEAQVKDYFLLNVNIGFKDSFWEDLGETDSFSKRISEYFEGGGGTDTSKEYFAQRKELIKRRGNLVRLYQDSKNASNIAVPNMTSSTREDIIELSEQINTMTRNLTSSPDVKAHLDSLGPITDTYSQSESLPNESYFGMLKDEGIDLNNTPKVIEFATKHMTAKNSADVKSLSNAMDLFVRSGEPLSLHHQKTFERVFGKNSSQNLSPHTIDFYQRAFAESRLEVYFKSLAPSGVGDVIRELSDTTGQTRGVEELIEELQNNNSIELSNHYTYYDNSTSSDMNKNYIRNFEGGMYQPSLDKYGDKDFISQNGITLTPDGIEGNNSKEFKAYQALMTFQRANLAKYGELGSHNIYKMPQISRSSMDTMINVVTGKGSKALIGDFIDSVKRFRVDEMEFGQEEDGESLYSATGLKVMPKMYLRDLEVMENISDDVLFSIMAMAQQAELYSARKETFSDVLALQETLIKRGNKDGKISEATNSYKMFMSYVDQNYYGINETFNKKVSLPIVGEIDIANVVSSFHKLIRWKNLAYKVIIPMTSLFTAKVQFFIERLVGQYVDNGSVRLARSAFNKEAMKTVNETMQVDTKSKLNVLGQYFGVFDLESTFKDSKYSRLTRFFGNMGYGLHTAGNFEPLSMAMLSTLYGHRVYDKQIVDFNTFKKLTGKDGKTAKAMWKNLEDKSMYQYFNVKDGMMDIDYEGVKEALEYDPNGSHEEFLNMFNNFEDSFRNKAKKLVERIDGNIRAEERTMLQRNFIGKYTMTHKGWLAIAMSNRFKGRHLNLQTGQEEEGSYMTLGKVLGRTFHTAFQKDGKKKLIEQYNNMTELEQTNLRRVGLELSVASMMYLIGLMATAFGNDDDNKDLMSAQLMAYMLERMSNETNSTQFGIGDEIYKSVKEPIVGLKQITDIFNVVDAVDSTKVKSGNYAGMSRASMYWVKNIAPLKEAYLFSDPNHMYKQRQSYQHFNDPTEFQMMSLFVTPESVKEWFN